MGKVEFGTKNLNGSRSQIWTELNRNILFGVEDMNVKAESLIRLTKEQLATSEGKLPDENS